MFSFFKRFTSGGNKSAEPSPASPVENASDEAVAKAAPEAASAAPAPAPAPATAAPAPIQPAAPQAAQAPVTAPAAPAAPVVPPPPVAAPAAPATPAATPNVPQSAPVRDAEASKTAVLSETPVANVPNPVTIAPEVEQEAEPETESAPEAEFEPEVETAPAPAPVVVKDDSGEAIGEIVAAPAAAPAAKRSWLTRLKAGLSKTSAGLTGIFVGVKVDENLFEELESALLMSDAGVEATTFLLDALRKKVKAERLTEGEQVKRALHDLLVELLSPLEQSLVLGREAPLVVMIAGVNGAGKTTSIGKLAKHFQSYDQSVLLAAGDTFRAAAREQLTIWGERNNVAVVAQESGDPAAVVFDAVSAARARKIDIVMADTAGRLPTQLHLMEELKKIKRVLGKAADGAPHEVLLVIDANTGQNALAQVKAFDDALQLTGLIVTKLDGTAKGGILAAIARQRPVPVYFIGVGEKVEDLQPFSAREFSDALLG
ncbi:signal recognition particle-docking protein FtsY [Pandoraea norimbergensis]|uniref:Signal recognition particle receptor FtsY n=1 Tax=Pandoraea norimbergensis TaxID=93219 RepID=A0ABN4JHC3_9BURK|nr:signal recognition particle-docking protein FtsY [Pandoraea norimbergensis]ALS60211.1 signal recognition particle-docking protein FtsY [Pandoraea norimbergensis]